MWSIIVNSLFAPTKLKTQLKNNVYVFIIFFIFTFLSLVPTLVDSSRFGSFSPN